MRFVRPFLKEGSDTPKNFHQIGFFVSGESFVFCP